MIGRKIFLRDHVVNIPAKLGTVEAIPSPDLWPSPRAMSCGTKTKKINNHPYSLKVSNKKSAQSKNNNYILIMYVEVDS